MKSYLMWAGGFVALLTILLVLVSGSFVKYSACEPVMNEIMAPTGDQASFIRLTETCSSNFFRNQDVYSIGLCAQTYVHYCSGLRNNLYVSYIAVIVGVALLVGGFITKEGDKLV